jgi:hypothetical protein
MKALTAARRLSMLRRAETLVWEMTHDRFGRCKEDESALHLVAHELYRTRMSVERPGWEIYDRIAREESHG